MKRIAVVFAVVAVLLLIDGSYLQLTNNQVGGDTGVLFGNANFVLSAGTVVLISGGFVLLGAAIMWAVAIRRAGGPSGGSGQVSGPPAGQAQTRAGAGQGQIRKGQDHHRQS
jgi:hypothetical protein